MQHRGRVKSLIGLVIEATGLRAEMGELCTISAGRNAEPIAAEVVGFRDGGTLLMPLGDMHGIGPGNPVSATGRPFLVPVGAQLLGRVLDGLGRPLDDLPAPDFEQQRSTSAPPPRPLSRRRIVRRLSLRRARARHARALRHRAAPRHLRRLGRRQVVAARHDRALDERRRQRHLPRRRARSRGARVHRARSRRCARALDRDRRDLGRAGARSDQGGARRDDDRRVVPRPRRRRAADDGLRHAPRDRAARAGPRDRRAAGGARLHAERVRAAAAAARARRHERPRIDHGALHRARRGRRHERPGRRLRALDPRRPLRAHARARAPQPLPAIDVLQSVSRLAGEVTGPDVRGAAGTLRSCSRCTARRPT